MNIDVVRESIDSRAAGEWMYGLVRELYPICRSITGDGLRETVKIVGRHIPLELREVASGTKVFDWTVPKEWNIRDAYVKDSKGERVIDFRRSNLHVVSYSVPVNRRMTLGELKSHLHTLPERPDWVPYRTSYYKEDWGFCLSHNQLLALEEGEYEVCIDSSLEDGRLVFGETFVEGETRDEVLVSCHACHPSLCDDNLSGVAVATLLAKSLRGIAPRYSYRFLFIPGTIGSITWLSLNRERAFRIKHGLVLTCVGDAAPPTYKKSRRGDADIDRAFAHVLRHSGGAHEIIDFYPYGYDERQYCSPGFNLPVGVLMRSQHGTFPEYHTSADDLDFVKPASLADSFAKCLSAFSVVENDRAYVNQNPLCEPQLGRRGLYKATGGQAVGAGDAMALLWVLNLSDGRHSLLDIAERSGIDFDNIRRAADALVERELLKEAAPRPAQPGWADAVSASATRA